MRKKILCIILSLMFAFESFAAIVSDNDGSAFVTKLEFDSLKSDFARQIENYNISIDNKIDGAIAAYLAGIRLSNKVSFEPFYPVRLDKSTGKLTNTVYAVNKGSFKKSKQYKSQYNIFCMKWNGRGEWGNSVTSLKPYTHNYANYRNWYAATINLQHKFNTTDKQQVFVTNKDHPTWVKNIYDLGYLNIAGAVSYIQLWIGSQQVWWIAQNKFKGKKLKEPITEWGLQGMNTNSFDNSSTTLKLGLITQDTQYNISSGNSLVYDTRIYYSAPGCAITVSKIEKTKNDNIYLFNAVDDKIVMYNENDEYLEEYTEEAYTTSDKLTKRQEVLYNGAGQVQASQRTDTSAQTASGWYVDSAWPRVRIQQRQNGKDASGNYIKYDNLNQLKNGVLEYKDPDTGEATAPNFSGGLPLFTMDMAATVDFTIKFADDEKSGLKNLKKIRVWVSQGEFLNKKVSEYTESEKASLVKFNGDTYVDVNIGVEKAIKISEAAKNKTYFLKFGDPTQEYGGRIDILDNFYYTYTD